MTPAKSSVAKSTKLRLKSTKSTAEGFLQKYFGCQCCKMNAKNCDFDSQVQGVNDTVHLQVSGTAESQVHVKTMYFNLQVQCVFSPCTCK